MSKSLKFIPGLILFLALLIPQFAHASTPGEMFTAMRNGEWETAASIAQELDESAGKGDVMLAFVDGAKASQEGRCETAISLFKLVLEYSPGFLPAYDALAKCLVKEGRRVEAYELYQDLANKIPAGPDKDIAQQRADSLKPNLDPKVTLDFSIIPSSNTSRRTNQTDTGNGGVLTEDSRAQDGVTIAANIILSKPIFRSDRMLSQVSLKTGIRYDSVTEKTQPVVGFEYKNTWFLSPRFSAFAAPFYEYTWQSGERYYDEYGLRFGAFHKFSYNKFSTFNASISDRDFKNDNRDATFFYASLGFTHVVDKNNKLNYFVNFAENNADNEFYNQTQYSVGVEWEHLFENGLITSVRGTMGQRFYDRNASLKFEEQEDDYYAASFGLSHDKIEFFNIRPELTYTYTNQTSNDLFSDFDAHDVGLRLKGVF